MKNIRNFLSENFPFLVVKFSIYLNRRVFVMIFRKSYKGYNFCAKGYNFYDTTSVTSYTTSVTSC